MRSFLWLLLWSSSGVAAPAGYEYIYSLNEQIKANAGSLDYYIQDVCVDGSDRVVAGDPATCSRRRNVRIGEKVPYLVSDLNTVTNERYQALFSYPTVGVDGQLRIMVSKIMKSKDNPMGAGFQFNFVETRDGFDLIDPNGEFPSIIRTSDGGCLDQKFSQMDGTRAGGWITGSKDLVSASKNHTTRIDRLSPGRPSSCAALSQSDSTRTVWNAPVSVPFASGKNLSALVSYHYAHQDLARKNNALEKFFFTKEYGFTRWESWIPLSRCLEDFASAPERCQPTNSKNILQGRCSPASGTTTFGHQTWVRIDCRDSTFYQALSQPILPLQSSMAASNGLVDVQSSAVEYAAVHGIPTEPSLAMTVEKDVVYDTVSARNKLDIYRPATPSTSPRPVLFYIHGGCYAEGDKDPKDPDGGFRQHMMDLTQDGFVVVSVNYRLKARYPAAVQDVQQALRFLRKNARQYNIDPARIIAHGQSAGGHLASLLGLKPAYARNSKAADAYSAPVPLVVDWFGRVDFLNADSACAKNLIGETKVKAKADYVDASPLSHISNKSAEFLIVHGTHDPLVPVADSVAFANALMNARRPVQLVLVEGEGHMYTGRPGFKTAWKLSRTKILEFVGQKSQAVTWTSMPKENILINAGSNVADASGRFLPDAYFSGGFKYTYATKTTKGAEVTGLYDSSRAGTDFYYQVDKEPGVYDVVLHFAEKSDTIKKAGARLFGVSLSAWKNKKEGKKVPVLPELDLYKIAGKNTALKRSITYVSESGPIKVNFKSTKGNSVIFGLEILKKIPPEE